MAAGLVVHPKVIERHLREELPFLATENLLMDATKAGGDRQELHERIRVLSQEAARVVKDEGRDNPLLELIAADPVFAGYGMTRERLAARLEPTAYAGCAEHQTERYLAEVVRPLLAANGVAGDADGAAGADVCV